MQRRQDSKPYRTDEVSDAIRTRRPNYCPESMFVSHDGQVTGDDEMPSLREAGDDAISLMRQLIQIDTTNTGDPDTTAGEALAAEFVESALQEVGYAPERFETSSASRQGVQLRIPGRDPDRGALLLHGHLDVVPAHPDEWSVPPFEALEQDGMIWGRGAVDMKDMDAMLLATVRNWARTGHVPPRDIILMFTPDEEAGGWQGAHWITQNRPELLEGATEGVGEVGGFSVTVDQKRIYFVQTAEKGIAWLELLAEGTAGHGSFLNDDNAVAAVSAAIVAIADQEWPITLTETTKALLHELADILDVRWDGKDPAPLINALGPVSRIVGATMRNTANPTMLKGSPKVNVIPGSATAGVDCRFIPGSEQHLLDTLDGLLPTGVTRSFVHRDVALETTFDGPTIAAMERALKAEDPGAHTVPYMLSGGTDAKAWTGHGLRCYGFAPLRLPADLDFASMFHGVDERVPIDAVKFGVRVLHRFLDDV